MGKVAVIAGPPCEPACQIHPPVCVSPKLAADTEPTAHKRVIVPEGQPRNTVWLRNSVTEADSSFFVHRSGQRLLQPVTS